MNPNDTFDPQRFGLITGSKCEVLIEDKRSKEVGQRTYARQLATNMYFRYYDHVTNWRTEHGNLAESSAFEYYQQNYDKNVIYQPAFIVKGDYGGQLDAISDIVVDFKCPTSLEGWLKYLFEPLDSQQYNQLQMYMMLADKTEARICAYLLETDYMANNGEQYPVDYDKRMIMVDVLREDVWMEKLEKNTPKVIEWRNEYYNQLVEQFGGQKL